MDSLERAFNDTEEAVASALNAAKELEKIVKALTTDTYAALLEKFAS